MFSQMGTTAAGRLARTVEALCALEDDLRQSMYVFVREQGRPVSREEVAQATGVSRKLAAFHLDKLVDKGLLRARFGKRAEARGRAGRSSKLYEPSDIQLEVSLPQRRYDLLGRILVDSLRADGPGQAPTRALQTAFEWGRRLGEEVRSEARLPPPGAERALSVAKDVLARLGYEPYRDETGGVNLRNCPFHALAQEAKDVVCSINRSYLEGLLRGLRNKTVQAFLETDPSRCCVVLTAGRATRVLDSPQKGPPRAPAPSP